METLIFGVSKKSEVEVTATSKDVSLKSTTRPSSAFLSERLASKEDPLTEASLSEEPLKSLSE